MKHLAVTRQEIGKFRLNSSIKEHFIYKTVLVSFTALSAMMLNTQVHHLYKQQAV